MVYDFDADNTVPVAQEIIASGETRIALVRNKYGRGVTDAIKTGLEAVESGPVLVTMADLSDEMTTVDKMYELYLQGYDLVCGSRYMPGGKLIGGPVLQATAFTNQRPHAALLPRNSHPRRHQQLQAVRRADGARSEG